MFYYYFIEVFCRRHKEDFSYSILFGGGRQLVKKRALCSLSVAMLIVVLSFSFLGSGNQSLACSACANGVVDKMPNEAFTVKITFKNTGKSKGAWSVNIAFEGESWTWSGKPQELSLKPYTTKTLTWNGSVPESAPIDSVARLIVYYNDSFTPLNWWIHVISGAELTITSSVVK
jgi:hypothetical protein